MTEVGNKVDVRHSQSALKGLFRLFRADAGSHVQIVGQTEAPKSLREEARTAMHNADDARAIALMEWQKHRRLSQIF